MIFAATVVTMTSCEKDELAAWIYETGSGTSSITTLPNMYNENRTSVSAPSGTQHVVAYSNWYRGYEDCEVYYRRYCSTCSTSAVRANTNTVAWQTSPDVAMSTDGSFVIVWSDYDLDGSNSCIAGQRFDTSGSKDGPEFVINRYTTGNQYSVSVARSTDGRFVVVWTSEDQDGSDYGVYAQRFDSSGNALGLLPW